GDRSERAFASPDEVGGVALTLLDGDRRGRQVGLALLLPRAAPRRLLQIDDRFVRRASDHDRIASGADEPLLVGRERERSLTRNNRKPVVSVGVALDLHAQRKCTVTNRSGRAPR